MHVLVIGAYGSAGVVVAERLADADAVDRLTLVDDGDPGGGLCILRGCMPSKEVLSAAAHRYQVRHDDRLVGETPALDLDRVVDSKDEHTSNFASHRRAVVHNIADREGVTFLPETARFRDDTVIEVGDEEYDPDYVVVATGSTINVPDLPGINDVDVLTSADVLDARDLPDSGVVMGFGYVGIELTAYMAEAGVDLTVIEHDERPLDDADPEYGDELLDIYREEFGIEVLTETNETRVEPTADGVRLHVERKGDDSTVDAETLFAFTGRHPALESLDADRVSLSPVEERVDETMQVSGSDRVFVVGDANGKEPLLHVAKEHGMVAADNVLAHAAGDELTEYENVRHEVVFSGAGVYPYARVGHTAAAAEKAGLDHVAVTRRAANDGVFATKDTERGGATLVVGTDGTVLGYQGLHYHADVMAKTMQVIVEMELDVREIPQRAFHPTTPEILDGLFREAESELAAADGETAAPGG